MSGAQPDVRLARVRKHFGGVTAVDGVSVDIARGSIFSLLKEGIWAAPNLTWPVVAVLAAGIAGAWFPPRAYDWLRGLFLRLPLPLQLALVAIVCLVVFKVSTAGAIPFVYERL